MSRKHFSWLLLLTIVAAVLVLLFPGRTGRESSLQMTLLVPELAEQVNGVDWLRLTGDGTVTTLTRDDKGWVVEEAFAYRADWRLVKNLLASLSRAEVIEQKTSNPKLYDMLGVEDVTVGGGTGVQVEFTPETGLPAVIIGNRAQGRSGQYARLTNLSQSVLIEPAMDLPKTQKDWLEVNIIDISDAETVEFEIIHPGGETIRAVKASANDENFELQDVPDSREIKSEWNVNAPANGLSGLELQDVAPATQFNWDEATRFRVLTADGLSVVTEILEIGTGTGTGTGDASERWIRLEAGVYQARDPSAQDGDQPTADTMARVERINDRVRGWAYRIVAYRADSMTRTMEDLLEPVGEESEPPAL